MNAIDLPLTGKLHLQSFPGSFTPLKAMHRDPKLHAQPVILLQCILKVTTVTQNIQYLLAHFYVAQHVSIWGSALLLSKDVLKFLAYFHKLFILFSYYLISHNILSFFYSFPHLSASHWHLPKQASWPGLSIFFIAGFSVVEVGALSKEMASKSPFTAQKR